MTGRLLSFPIIPLRRAPQVLTGDCDLTNVRVLSVTEARCRARTPYEAQMDAVRQAMTDDGLPADMEPFPDA